MCPWFTASDGTQLYYEDKLPDNGLSKKQIEDIPTIFMLHGWASSSSFWSEMQNYLAKMGYRTIAVDGRGHGRSKVDLSPTQHLSDTFISDFNELTALLGFGLENGRKIGLFGHSAGGAVSQMIAIDDGKKGVDRLAVLGLFNTTYALVIDSIFSNVVWNAMPTLIRVGYTGPVPSLLNAALKTMMPVLGIALNRASSWTKSMSQHTNDIFAMSKKNIEEEMKQIFSFDGIKGHEMIDVPTLIMGAAFDALVSPARSHELHKMIKNSALHIIPASGHGMILERSDRVNKLTGDWLQEIWPTQF